MDEVNLSARLEDCFQVVFPHLTRDALSAARQDSLEAWDSVAAITLISVVEDEFQVKIDLERLPQLTSFGAFLACLKGIPAGAE